MLAEALRLHAEDQAACDAIGANGADELGTRRRILTHCNTGRLATGGNGTALGVIYALQDRGAQPQVLATEARPVLQGARLTAWELMRSGVDIRLIPDGAAGFAMARGMVDAVIVGCDRVAANGDTANKIGTYQLAVLANRHGVPFYVAGPRSSFDADTPTGAEIVVEERNPDEVRRFRGVQSAPADVGVWNPAFDVTPADLVTAFITEVGVLRPPFGPSIRAALTLVGRRPKPSGLEWRSNDDAGAPDRPSHRELRREHAWPDVGRETKELLCQLLRAYYERNWVAGTGGGICGPTEDGFLFLAPTGVHKELVQPRDFFVVDPADGPSYDRRRIPPSGRASAARSSAPVPGSGAPALDALHALIAVLAGDLGATRDHLAIERPGDAQGHPRRAPTRTSTCVPVIRNTARERDLVAQVEATLARPPVRAVRSRSSSPITARTSGATTSGRRSVTSRSTTSCSRRFSPTVNSAAREDPHDGTRRSRPRTFLCPNCQQPLPHSKIDVVDVAAAVEADKLQASDAFRRTYIGHGKMSSVFVFQGHAGPFRRHVHVSHDEIGYVLAGSGSVTVGGVTRPVKPGDVWIIPANMPARGRVRRSVPGDVRVVADRRPRQPGPGLGGVAMVTSSAPRTLPSLVVPVGSITPYVLVVGDPDRAKHFSERLDDARLRPAASGSSTRTRARGGARPHDHVARRRRRGRGRGIRGTRRRAARRPSSDSGRAAPTCPTSVRAAS